MPTYILLTNWTDQGVKNAKASPKRQEDARKLAKKFHVEWKTLFMTMGAYDFVLTVEAPSPEPGTVVGRRGGPALRRALCVSVFGGASVPSARPQAPSAPEPRGDIRRVGRRAWSSTAWLSLSLTGARTAGLRPSF